MSEINNPHDQFFRHTLSDIHTAREFISAFFPAKLLEQINLETLQSCESNYVGKELGVRIVDKLFAVEYYDKSHGYLYLLQEHQSTPDKLMPFRCLQYRVCIWDHYHKQKKQYNFPPIHVAVFYHGKAKWHHSTSFLDLIHSAHQTEMQSILQSSFELIDINQIPDEKLRKKTKLGLMTLTMKHIFTKELLPILQEIEDIANYLAHTAQKEYIQTAMIYLFKASQVKDPRSVLDYIKHHYDEFTLGDGVMAKTMAQYFEERGRQEGRQEGFRNGLLQTARKMLLSNMQPQQIANITGLDINEILAEAEKLKQTAQ